MHSQGLDGTQRGEGALGQRLDLVVVQRQQRQVLEVLEGVGPHTVDLIGIQQPKGTQRKTETERERGRERGRGRERAMPSGAEPAIPGVTPVKSAFFSTLEHTVAQMCGALCDDKLGTCGMTRRTIDHHAGALSGCRMQRRTRRDSSRKNTFHSSLKVRGERERVGGKEREQERERESGWGRWVDRGQMGRLHRDCL